MEYLYPKFEKKYHPAGTYKITFDDKWFYIGSSVNVRRRCMRWKFCLLTGKFLKSTSLLISVRGKLIKELQNHSQNGL